MRLVGRGITRFPGNELPHMPGSSTTPGRPGARAHAPVRVAFRIRNGVGTRDMNLCEAQWLACVLPYRRFAAALTGDRARLRADVVRYSVIVSDLHRLLVAGLPTHCERFCTLSQRWIVERTIAGLNRCRRLAKDWENFNRKALAFLRLASIHLMLRKLCNQR